MSAKYEGPNLRGCAATVVVDGRECRVRVVTHIRDDRWLVEGRLPSRFRRRFCQPRATVHRSEITVRPKP